MSQTMQQICNLALKYDKPDSEMLKQKKVYLGLRRPDGSGVVVGITSKGQVDGYKRVSKENEPESWKLVPIPGELHYCGYDVAELVRGVVQEKRFGFEEAAYLLLTSELPGSSTLADFRKMLAERAALPKLLKSIIMNQSMNDDQMNALHRAVSAMSLFDTNPSSVDLEDVVRQCVDLMAKFPAIVAYNYNAMAMDRGDISGTGIIEPHPDLSIAQNFLLMLTGKVPDFDIAQMLDICLILHAEHGGGNNSTFTVRTVSSSGANTYMAISSGIASLSGHLHGGANESAMKMLQFIKTDVKDWKDEEEIEQCLLRIMHRESGDRTGKLYGIGHAVYTISDPRAVILEEIGEKLAKKTDTLDEFELFKKVGRIGCELVLKHKNKVVCTNVDFYSGFVYQALGIPTEVYTPMFAMARISGWCAHRIEEIIQGRIIRPAFASSIRDLKRYIPLTMRNSA